MKILFAGSITVWHGTEKKPAQLTKEGSRFSYVSPFSGERVVIGNIKKLVRKAPKLAINHNGHLDSARNKRRSNKVLFPTVTKNAARVKSFQKQEGKCHYCGLATDLEKWTIDHLLPMSRGGKRDHSSNTVGACFTCNHAKGNMTYEEFLKTDYLPLKRRSKLGFNDEPIPFSVAKGNHRHRLKDLGSEKSLNET